MAARKLVEKLYIISFIINAGFISYHDTNVTVKVQECSTWEDARSKCPSVYPGSYLPLIWDQLEYDQVRQAMISMGVNVTWLQLRRRHLGEFLWVNCQPATEDFLARGWARTSNCAYLALSDESLAAGFCFRRHGVICEIKDCRHCEDTHCLHIRDRCFYKTCTGFTWDAARTHCRSQGWDLALPLDSWTERQLRQLLSDHQPVCEYLWVGLRREEWVYPTMGSRNISHGFWEIGQPGLQGDCSVMEMSTSGEYRWRAVTCNEKFQSLCVKNQITTQAAAESYKITPASTTKADVPGRSDPMIYSTSEERDILYVITAGVFLTMIITLLLTIYLLTRRKMSKFRQLGYERRWAPVNIFSEIEQHHSVRIGSTLHNGRTDRSVQDNHESSPLFMETSV